MTSSPPPRDPRGREPWRLLVAFLVRALERLSERESSEPRLRLAMLRLRVMERRIVVKALRLVAEAQRLVAEALRLVVKAPRLLTAGEVRGARKLWRALVALGHVVRGPGRGFVPGVVMVDLARVTPSRRREVGAVVDRLEARSWFRLSLLPPVDVRGSPRFEAARAVGQRLERERRAREEGSGAVAEGPWSEPFVQLRCGRGRERDLVREICKRLPEDLREQVLLSRLPRIRLESAREAPLLGRVGDLTQAQLTEHARLALETAGIDRLRGTGEQVHVVVYDSGFDEARIAALTGGTAHPMSLVLPGGMGRAATWERPHGTAVIAAVHAAAPHALIEWVPLPAEEWQTIAILRSTLVAAQQARYGGVGVVVNLSMSYEVGFPSDHSEYGAGLRTQVMDSFKGGVVVVAATGNQGPKDERGRMAYPARDAYVVAVGAAALDGRRAAVSRYGSKDLGPGRWFMVRAPESSPGVLAPLVQVGSDTFTNTSIATAMATGLIVSSGLVDVRPPPFFDDVERHARAVAMADAFLTLADAAQVPGYDRREHGDGVLRIPARDAPRSA